MSLAIQSLVHALAVQTEAINRLTQTNVEILHLLVEMLTDDERDDLPFTHYLNDQPLDH
jgi:hypothetical protein